MDKIDALLESIGEMNADLDDILDEKSKKYGELFRKILEDQSMRDADLWDMDGSPLDYSLSEYMQVLPLDRDDKWVDDVSLMISSAKIQAMLDSGILRDILKISESNGEKIKAHSNRLSFDEMRKAAVKIKGSGVTNAAKSRRSNPARVSD